MWCKFRFAQIQILIKASFQNFAHVQKSLLRFDRQEWKQNTISIEFDDGSLDSGVLGIFEKTT